MKLILICASALLAACGAKLDPAISVERGWARATPTGASSAAAYLMIVNRAADDDRLISVTVSRAAAASLHASSIDQGVMRMRALETGLAIPGNATVRLAPNGVHIMLTGLAAPLRPGERIRATLRFARSGPKTAVIVVETAMAR